MLYNILSKIASFELKWKSGRAENTSSYKQGVHTSNKNTNTVATV